MRPGELLLVKHADDDRHTLALRGELDLSSSDDLEAAVLQSCSDGAKEIVLDLGELAFVDSAGLRALLSVREVCEQRDARLSLTNPLAPVRRLFELTGVGESLSVRDTAAPDGAPVRERTAKDNGA
jgi:stage II sporulation protein AA (anti-sigma F factor antagonist)